MFFKRILKKQENEHPGKIFAAQSGRVIPVTEVSDEVFSQKILGDGVAILPESDTIVSPVDGEIVNVAETFHAYGIKTSDGIEVLVHIGINTVELSGKGFRNKVKTGQQVKVGTPLSEVDFRFLKESGYPTDVIILVTNQEEANVSLELHTETSAQAGQTCVIEYRK